MKLVVNLVCLYAVSSALAAAQDVPKAGLGSRQLLGGLSDRLLGALNDTLKAGDIHGLVGVLEELSPAATPTSVEQVLSILQEIAATTPNMVEYASRLVASGVKSASGASLLDYARGLGSPENGHDNRNPDPPRPVYPQAGVCDAPYSVPETSLRSAIFIPETFTYGKKPPVILFPGTGLTGYISFRGNFIPLLTGVDYADPVWVNMPSFLLEDVQVNAEYAAYALNYIASLTNQNVSIVAFSQGNIDAQWAFKHWPSTRLITSDHIAISADYKGSTLLDVINVLGIVRTPSIVQQEAGSSFITSLRSNGGDSGYVPTTSIYSGLLDEIVQPQSGTGASAFLLDARGVGVTNTEVQVVCPGQPGGGVYTHESLLAGSLTFALAKDALTNDGPGQVSRLNLAGVCGSYLAPRLGLRELLTTESSIVVAVLAAVLYLPKVAVEPPIRGYAMNEGGCKTTRQQPGIP